MNKQTPAEELFDLLNPSKVVAMIDGHCVKMRKSPITYQAICSCGWSYRESKYALVRGAKLKEKVRKHICSEASHETTRQR